MDDITQFVKININTKNEKKLLTPGYSYFYNISLNDSILYWTERRYHPRWEHVKYQIIMSYDFRSGKRKQLTHRTSYFFPVISPNNKEIACISNLKDGGNSLILLNSTDGSLKKKIPIKEYIKNLSYSDNGEYIYFYKLQQNGYVLVELQIETLNERIILPASYNNRNWILLYSILTTKMELAIFIYWRNQIV